MRIAFTEANGMANVTIEDDGIGFDMVEVTLSPDSGQGLGLLGMQERVELLGGQMHMDSAPGYACANATRRSRCSS